jgi:uncharacterized protein (TIGR02569 family)
LVSSSQFDHGNPVARYQIKVDDRSVRRSGVEVPSAVADAFGVPRNGRALPGGQGDSARHGDVVLKRVADRVEAEWTAGTISSIEPSGYRLPRPLHADDGRWVVDGWTATEFVAGEPGPQGHWDELFAAARAFHGALADASEPSFLAARGHRWAIADRVAWDESTVTPLPEVAALLERLLSWHAPVSAPAQLVHDDLAGNVLFADGLPPAIIDFSPYWRPVGYAEAMIAVDGMLWFGGGPDLEPLVARDPEFVQFLIRALTFRLVAHNQRAVEVDPTALDELPQFVAVADRIERLSIERINPARPERSTSSSRR